ncbi:G-type lectin S-receptor-like serine/threonine-protein kinase At1g11410 [Hevea brasiliensis]|uniref:G-type lectin S-receptor-like serine/threonine-protein kinase At1g11410 n=1 Tax=Hevea brasiliensis TaxID=3981 RepID=UPI0025EE0F93|nr:G-type lectin S-receptor-like serine/threonine-protein kinase At1g11410 [Hevea brasiliensis]
MGLLVEKHEMMKVSKQSVVWVAKRDNLITASSGILSSNPYGNLVLYNDPDQKVLLWSANGRLSKFIRSEDDPGDYSIKLHMMGIRQIFLYKGSRPQWRASLWPWKIFSDICNYSYAFNQEEIYFSYHLKDAPIILKVIVDDSGFNKWLRWHKSDS